MELEHDDRENLEEEKYVCAIAATARAYITIS